MAFEKITEKTSSYRHLEKMSIAELLANINKEDQTVPDAVAKAIPQIEKLVEAVSDKMLMGGRRDSFCGTGQTRPPPRPAPGTRSWPDRRR